jgi:hypothetical protein
MFQRKFNITFLELIYGEMGITVGGGIWNEWVE